MLAESKDAPLLTAVALRLFVHRMPMSSTSGPYPELLALAKDYVNRALAIQPDYDHARVAQDAARGDRNYHAVEGREVGSTE
jgi:hypothetical protein